CRYSPDKSESRGGVEIVGWGVEIVETDGDNSVSQISSGIPNHVLPRAQLENGIGTLSSTDIYSVSVILSSYIYVLSKPYALACEYLDVRFHRDNAFLRGFSFGHISQIPVYGLTDRQPSSTMEHLAHLASKPGVKATLILSKVDGAIIGTTGLAAGMSASTSDTPQPGNSTSGGNGGHPVLLDEKAGYESQGDEQKHSAEEVAKMAFSLVSAAAVLVKGLDDGDEAQLLRLRTRKNEIVVVPGKQTRLKLGPG
ncbi:MAG: hypothetical protein Q9187_003661, partial [Circinaria calcarea]